MKIISKSQHHSAGNFLWRAPARVLHTAYQLPYVYDYVTKLCRQGAEMVRNHENANGRNIGQGEAQRRKYKWLELGGGQA
jgi:hypothetical protein